ncbi:type IV pilus assembly protein PilM [Clostridium estertheticum]|uniref:Type IV pilus assembly protein PilM n=1 Tax=Clostridium estertheticum TaxID=238834 RepID=A0AA47EJY6_9CLOT|nr:type IV pilus assembly protein PilM [Clostridium estertheticum]MBU3153364.1 type IV pilus assembly protein PilM [Clostridium estertheticum]WAG60769.1 type IV pilus assembly protein PilM [Clostridium estertheticum]
MFNSKVLSLDIGSKNTKIVLGTQHRKNIIIEKAITMSTPVGCYNDGNILDVTKLKDKISDVLQAENIKCKNIIITTKSTTVITRDIDIPVAKKEDMDSIIKFQMERYLPIKFDDYIMQYKILEEFEDENIKQAKFAVVVYPKIMVDGYYNLVKELQGNAIALDISSNSINKLFIDNIQVNDENYSLDDTVAVIDLGHDFTNVNIISDGNVLFTRIINYGGSHIDVDIANQLSISEEEAEDQKFKNCNLERESLSDMQSSMVNDIAKAQVRNWIREIEKLLNYYKNKKQENKIDKIYIYGGSSNLKGIEMFIKDIVNLPVIRIHSLSNVNCSKINAANVDSARIDEELSKYLNAIGAIIRLR